MTGSFFVLYKCLLGLLTHQRVARKRRKYDNLPKDQSCCTANNSLVVFGNVFVSLKVLFTH